MMQRHKTNNTIHLYSIGLRVCIIAFITLFCIQSSISQDTLVKIDGSKHVVNIINVDKSEIRYTMYSDSLRLIHVANSTYISKVIYSNGFVDVFPEANHSNVDSYTSSSRKVVDFKRNFISASISDAAFKYLSVSYEHILKAGIVGFRLTGTTGLNNYYIPEDFYYSEWNHTAKVGYAKGKNKIYECAINLNIYAGGQKKAGFFYGPSFNFGKYKNYYEVVLPYSAGAYDYSEMREEIVSFKKLFLNAGFLFQPTNRINISSNIGVGVAIMNRIDPHSLWDPYDVYYFSNNKTIEATKYNRPIIDLNLSIGFKF